MSDTTPAKRFSQNWDEPGVYREILAIMTTAYKPSKEVLMDIVAQMNERGYQFTYHGL